MSAAKDVEQLRQRAQRERNATTALELRVQALELEVAALRAAKPKKTVKRKPVVSNGRA